MEAQLKDRDTRTRSYKVVNNLRNPCPGHPEKFFHVPPRSSDEPTLLERYRTVNLGLYLIVRPVSHIPAQGHLIFFQVNRPIDIEQYLAPCACGQCAEHCGCRGNDSMLVGVVEFTETPENVVFRGVGESVVRLFPFYKRGFELGYTFYHSARTGSIGAPALEDGELKESWLLNVKTGIVKEYEMVNKVVKGGPQLVQGLSGHQDDIGIKADTGVPDGGERSNKATTFIRFFVDMDGVWFTLCKLDKPPIEVVDYGLGPKDLEPYPV